MNLQALEKICTTKLKHYLCGDSEVGDESAADSGGGVGINDGSDQLEIWSEQHQLLILGIAYKGIAFPVLWLFLPKQGNSNTAERIELIERFLDIFGWDKVAYLVADREFVGKAWFAYLRSRQIRLRIRITQDTLLANARGVEVNAWTLFRDLKPGEARLLSGIRRVWGCEVYVVRMKLEDGDFLIVVSSDSPTTFPPECSYHIYINIRLHESMYT